MNYVNDTTIIGQFIKKIMRIHIRGENYILAALRRVQRILRDNTYSQLQPVHSAVICQNKHKYQLSYHHITQQLLPSGFEPPEPILHSPP